MEEDCEVYVDPEEDEVFFGCVSEKEKDLYSKLVKKSESTPRSKDDCKLDEYACGDCNIEDVNNKNVDGLIIKNSEANEDSDICGKDSENSQDFFSFYSNTSVEIEHNYSTPMKNKIDKTILSTPKSMVKADRDGGFLKVLSEIALVKAEADKKEDEDKENQIIPEIRITEATPEKVNVTSPPKSNNKQLRRFRIIYNSPNYEENSESSKKTEKFESSQNLKNKCLFFDSRGNGLNNEKRKSVDVCNQSINLIDWNESGVMDEKDRGEDGDVLNGEQVNEIDKLLSERRKEVVLTKKEEPELVLTEDKDFREVDQSLTETSEDEKEDVVFIDSKMVNQSLKDTIEAEKEEGELVLVGDKDSINKSLNETVKTKQKEKKTIEAHKKEHVLVLVEDKDCKMVKQSLKNTIEAEKEERGLVLVDSKDSINQSLKETVEAQQNEEKTVEAEKEERELVLPNNKDYIMLKQSLKDTIEAAKEERELVLVDSKDSLNQSLKETVEAQQKEEKTVEAEKEELESVLVDGKDSIDQSLKETVEAQQKEDKTVEAEKEERELVLVDSKDSLNQSLKETVEAQQKEEKTVEAEKEELESVLVDGKDSIDQSLKETVEAQQKEDKTVEAEKEERELVLVDGKDSIDQSLKETGEVQQKQHELVLVGNKNSKMVKQSLKETMEAEKEERELVLVDGKDSIDQSLKETVGAHQKEEKTIGAKKEEGGLVLVDSKDPINQLLKESVKTWQKERELILFGRKDHKMVKQSPKKIIEAEKEERELLCIDSKDYKMVDQSLKDTIEAEKEERELVLVGSKDSKTVEQSLKDTIKAQQEERELVLVDSKDCIGQSLKETVEPQQEEHKLVLVDSKDYKMMDQSLKDTLEAEKEERELVLVDSNDYKMEQSLKDTIKAQQEEHKLVLVGSKDSKMVEQSLKDKIKAQQEERELILVDSIDSKEVDQSLKNTIEAQQEKHELILVDTNNVDQSQKEVEEKKIEVKNQLVEKIEKEEPELITLDVEVEERVESTNKSCRENPEMNSQEKLEEDRKSEELSNNGIMSSSSDKQNIPTTPKPTENPETRQQVPACRRFSKDARMIVDVLKKFTAEDTLNFTIQEIDAENVENSFLSPEPMSCFDETIVPNQAMETPKPKKSSPRFLQPTGECRSAGKPATVEKERCKLTPSANRQPIKYFSERKIYNQNAKDRGKMLPIEEKIGGSEEKMKGIKTIEKGPLSKIPVFGSIKTSKIPTIGRFAATKTTPMKTPTTKTYKNPKFNNIESPINAYITNKPTSLVLNVKPEVKKDSVTKMWKAQTISSGKKIPQEKGPKVPTPNRLPFVEYRSATPYKVEKKSESKLPRLAPTVQKLIGSQSPRVLKHEGRFYLKTPKKPTPVEDVTILADPNEVSVVVCQTAQKSNTFKNSTAVAMRQLKGKTKETNKQKKERKKDFLENKKKVFTIVLPSLAAVFFLIVVYVYLKTKPKMNVEM